MEEPALQQQHSEHQPEQPRSPVPAACPCPRRLLTHHLIPFRWHVGLPGGEEHGGAGTAIRRIPNTDAPEVKQPCL